MCDHWHDPFYSAFYRPTESTRSCDIHCERRLCQGKASNIVMDKREEIISRWSAPVHVIEKMLMPYRPVESSNVGPSRLETPLHRSSYTILVEPSFMIWQSVGVRVNGWLLLCPGRSGWNFWMVESNDQWCVSCRLMNSIHILIWQDAEVSFDICLATVGHSSPTLIKAV